mgnify:CR=1 FL=1
MGISTKDLLLYQYQLALECKCNFFMEYLFVLGAVLTYWIFHCLNVQKIEEQLNYVLEQWTKEIVQLDPAIRIQRIAYLSKLAKMPNVFRDSPNLSKSFNKFHRSEDNAKCIQKLVDSALSSLRKENLGEFGENYPPALNKNFGDDQQLIWLEERLKQVKEECIKFKK